MTRIAKFFLIVLGVVSLLPIASSRVRAQAGQSITIIPPKFELFSNPGDTLVERIRVRNNTDTPLAFAVVVDDFTTSGEEGHVVLEEGESNTTYSLANWIETETSDLILQPNEETYVNFLINVPRDAEPGGHYASVLFQSGGESEVPGTAVVTQRVGSLVLLRVSGNVTENANLESFTVPSYSDHGPITFSLRVKNEGNVHMRPEGTIIITNLFGNKVAELPLDSRNVLPGAVRRMDTVWEQENLLGRYKATLLATYGEGSQKKHITSAVTFTVASKMAILAIGGSMLLVLAILITLISGRKRISKAMKVMAKG